MSPAGAPPNSTVESFTTSLPVPRLAAPGRNASVLPGAKMVSPCWLPALAHPSTPLPVIWMSPFESDPEMIMLTYWSRPRCTLTTRAGPPAAFRSTFPAITARWTPAVYWMPAIVPVLGLFASTTLPVAAEMRPPFISMLFSVWV